MNCELHHGDCLEVMQSMEADSVDAIVTDPPAGIAFMGKGWDTDKGGRSNWIKWMQAVAAECLRVIKPGGHALVWAIPRTSHWTGMAWEDAGWQCRDKIYHCFGSGFPKSLDVGKAIDKAAGFLGVQSKGANYAGGDYEPRDKLFRSDYGYKYTPSTEAAKQWDGWGTALKPAIEEWWLFRKPLTGTVAENVMRHGVGGINVGACRVGVNEKIKTTNGSVNAVYGDLSGNAGSKWESHESGRWPANLIHSGEPEVLALFPETGASKATPRNNGEFKSVAKGRDLPHITYGHDDNGGSAARFFYCTKADKRDRDEGCEGLPEVFDTSRPWCDEESDRGRIATRLVSKTGRNHHPTVKNTDLMRYLCKLITPPDGLILDPFMGSGSTGKAAMLEKFRFVGIEQEAEYLAIARARIEYAAKRRAYKFGLIDMLQHQEAAI